MAQPASRSELIAYCKRQLGAPVLEINVADEQIDDLVDDALQLFQERDYDGTTNAFLKYKITQADIDRGRGRGGSNPIGIVTTTASSTIDGSSVSFSFEENSNYLQVPPEVLGVTKIYHFDGSNTTTNNMFSIFKMRNRIGNTPTTCLVFSKCATRLSNTSDIRRAVTRTFVIL